MAGARYITGTVIGKTFITHSPVGKCYIPPCPVKAALIPDPFSAPQEKAADKQQLCPKVDFRTFLQRPPVNTTNKQSRLPVPLIWICPDMPGYFFQLLFTSRGQLALKTGVSCSLGKTPPKRSARQTAARHRGLPGTLRPTPDPGGWGHGRPPRRGRPVPHRGSRRGPPGAGSRLSSEHRPRAEARLRSASPAFSSSSCLRVDPLPNRLLGQAESPGKSPLARCVVSPPPPPNMTPCVGEEDRRPL